MATEKSGDGNQAANTLGKVYSSPAMKSLLTDDALEDYYEWEDDLADMDKEELDEELDGLLEALGNEEKSGPVSSALKTQIEAVREAANKSGIALEQTGRYTAYAMGNFSQTGMAAAQAVLPLAGKLKGLKPGANNPFATLLKGKPGLKKKEPPKPEPAKPSAAPQSSAATNVKVKGTGKSKDPCKHPNDAKKKKYVVYKADELDKNGNKIGTYVGRTSGKPGESTASILARRQSGHHRNVGPLERIFETDSYAGVRGAEQLLRDKHSTVKQINPISPKNKRKEDYLDCAKSKGAG
jgi:hypothetical protein